MASQEMRSTQLLFNHGPGSVLETVNGPVVVQKWSSFLQSPILQNEGFPHDFEIKEIRLSEQLHSPNGQAQLHRIPSNVEVGLSSDRYLLKTNRFPDWLICNRANSHGGHAILFQHGTNPELKSRCPQCSEKGAPIRFVQYCTNGHMDDVQWRNQICGYPPSAACENSSFEWHEKNASMQGVQIVCRHCRKRKSLSEIAKKLGKCTARHPHELPPDHRNRPRNCTAKPKVTQRQSSILWQGQSSRVITVPTEDRMSKLIEKLLYQQLRTQTPFDTFLILGGQNNVEKLTNWVENVLSHMTPPHLKPDLVDFRNRINNENGVDEFKNTWNRLISGTNTHAIIESYRQEWRGLVGLERPQKMENNKRGYDFVMNGDSSIGTFGDLRLKIEPVERLRTVTALTGFSRGAIGDIATEHPPRTVPLNYQDDTGIHWYAAAEAFGEGLLITFDEESTGLFQGIRWNKWINHHNELIEDAVGEKSQTVPWLLFRSTAKALMLDEEWSPDEEVAGEYFAEAHPMFVWWHTFAHHFIRAVQAETGYSSSAISERIYAVPENGEWKGAILLYVTEGGMDGTLGGLTSLYTHFQTFLDRVLEDAQVCSMDPLCEEAPDRMLGDVGCYACTFNPETSCEHRNMFLDRLLLVEGAND